MASITSWVRLEPRCRDDSMQETVRARLYDPLWMLARQWQVGEFQAEDTGSPVLARWRAESTPLTRYHAGAVTAQSMSIEAPRYDAGALPLEAMVERQRVRSDRLVAGGSLRMVVESGLHFLRMLDAQAASRSYRTDFTAPYLLDPPSDAQRATLDAETLAYWQLYAGRVPDARKLVAALRKPNGKVTVPAALDIADGDRAEVEKAAGDWLAYHDSLFSEPAAAPANDDAWIRDRMEYAFTVAGALSEGETALTAAQYFEGHLDWHSVDVDPQVSLGAAADKAATQIVRAVIPSPVSFRGAPAQRYWEFEDARIDYGLLPAGPGDLPQLMLSEFATSYGNDWYVIPLDLPIGTLTRTRSLVVTDSFGVQTLIRPINDAQMPNTGWSMFELAPLQRELDAPLRPISNLFYLAPSLVKNLEGRNLEEVLFLRDEMANLAWAVEHAVQGPVEQRIDASEPTAGTATQPAPAAAPLYRLATEVPANWMPLLPQRQDAGTAVRLVRAAFASSDGSNALRVPRSALLDAAGPRLALYDEEVAREGVRVTRSFQYTRWLGGSTQLWLGYRKQIGRGEGASGLRFDSFEG